VLYNQFLSQVDFDTVKNYAESLGVSVWSSDRGRTLVVTREGHNNVKKFWRQHSRGR
jgi:transcription initiation factor TFIIH subunit 4